MFPRFEDAFQFYWIDMQLSWFESVRRAISEGIFRRQ